MQLEFKTAALFSLKRDANLLGYHNQISCDFAYSIGSGFEMEFEPISNIKRQLHLDLFLEDVYE